MTIVRLPGKPHKYRAERQGGHASIAEDKCAWELKLLEQAGKIRKLKEQVPFDLLPAKPEIGYKQPLRYIADFVFWEPDESDSFNLRWNRVVADKKGFRTPVYKLKRRLLHQLHGIDIREL